MRARGLVLLGALVVAAAASAVSCGGGDPLPPSGARLISPAAFEAALDDPARVAINVHTPDEGSLSGTELAIPFDRLAARQEELPDVSTPLAVYCRSGAMSADAVETLGALGFEDIVELEGGMLAWAETGRPIIAATDE